MSKKTEERLRWALRYIVFHPDISPSILAEEWEIPIEDAINICAQHFALAVGNYGIGIGKKTFSSFEKRIFEKLMDLK